MHGSRAGRSQRPALTAASSCGTWYVAVFTQASTDSDQLSITEVARKNEAHGVSDINCVAWAPAREEGHAPAWLASAGDDGAVSVWTVGAAP